MCLTDFLHKWGFKMEIEILDYFAQEEPSVKKGLVDFIITYENGKSETFRNVSHMQKDNKSWLSVGKVKRGEKWIDRYERNPSLYNLFKEVLKELEKYLIN